MELYDHTSDIEIVVVIVEGVLSRDSWAAQRIEVTDHVRDRGFHCPSVGQSTQTCLGDTGYVDGRDIRITHQWADGEIDRLPALAAELVEKRVAVIVAAGCDAVARAAKAATTTIPIIFI